MQLWNFCHNIIGIQVYEFLALAVVLVMAIIAVVHIFAMKRRQATYDAKLREIKAASTFPRGGTASATRGGNDR